MIPSEGNSAKIDKELDACEEQKKGSYTHLQPSSASLHKIWIKSISGQLLPCMAHLEERYKVHNEI